MIDTHIHLEQGEHNIEWVNRFVNVALEKGIKEIHLLEHSHRFKEFKGIYADAMKYNQCQEEWFAQAFQCSLNDYKSFIKEMKGNNFPIEIKFGLEVCYFEGKEEIIKHTLKNFDWDFITGSVHWIDGWGFDHKKMFWDGINVNSAYIRYYEIMKNLIKSGLFDIVAHPDSIKCFGHTPSIDLTETYYEIAELLIKYQMSAEENAGLYFRYGHDELGMNSRMKAIFMSEKVNILTASDAHKPEDTGKFIKELMMIQASI